MTSFLDRLQRWGGMGYSPDMDNNLDPKDGEMGFSLPGRPAEPPVRKHPYALFLMAMAAFFALALFVIYIGGSTPGLIPKRFQKSSAVPASTTTPEETNAIQGEPPAAPKE